MKPYRILSLDGGGVWSLIQVMALQKIYTEHTPGHKVLKDFDLVVATSGGSITLGGLVTNLPLSEILTYFSDEKKCSQIFNPLPFALVPGKPLRYVFHRFMRWLFPIGAKYRTKAKLRGLNKVLAQSDGVFVTSEGKKITSPDYHLWELPEFIKRSPDSGGKCPDLLICSFNYDRRRAKFFRSKTDSKSSGSAGRERATLAEAIHASTNAPINFFVSPAVIDDAHYWDGAIAGFNNPVLAGVTEALANGEQREAIRVLSLGTGTVALPPSNAKNRSDDPKLLQSPHESTLLGDIEELSTSILDDPPDAATYVSHVILSPKGLEDAGFGPLEEPVVRMSPLVRPRRSSPSEKWKLPDGWGIEFKYLFDLEMDGTHPTETEEKCIELLKLLAEAWFNGVVANQAIRENADLECDIGDPTFTEALQHWKALMTTEPSSVACDQTSA